LLGEGAMGVGLDGDEGGLFVFVGHGWVWRLGSI
jgi:hypothetical protein